MAFRAPLLGYNTNVRHKGKLYHIQTEDSGTNYAHIITHLFADGGRIVASRKTSYGDQVGNDGLQDAVKKLMQAQHKAMFIALRDGVYDDDGPSDPARENTGLTSVSKEDQAALASPAPAVATVAAAAAAPAAHAAPAAKEAVPERTSLYQGTRAAAAAAEPAALTPSQAKAPVSIFGGDLLTEKSLDEVILSYLATDDGDSQ